MVYGRYAMMSEQETHHERDIGEGDRHATGQNLFSQDLFTQESPQGEKRQDTSVANAHDENCVSHEQVIKTNISLADGLITAFLQQTHDNSEKNVESLGILAGRIRVEDTSITISHVFIPDQTGDVTTCECRLEGGGRNAKIRSYSSRVDSHSSTV